MKKNKETIKKKNETNKQQQYKQKQEQHMTDPVYIRVKWCHTVMQTVRQHQGVVRWTST